MQNKAVKALYLSLGACLSLAACAGNPVVVAAPSDCAAILPESWKKPVEPPPLPEGDTVGDWVSFSDAAIGKLDVANDRTVSAIGIVERCEARSAAALQKSRPRFLGLF